MESIFERFKMNEIRDVLGAKMSTGMRQKVSIARAIVHDPPVLIFDEATAGLDVLVARALLNRVAELRQSGKCIIFSTHIMREAEKLCDRVAIMHRGQILAEGTLEELRAEHGEDDLEELFFQLISRHEQSAARRQTSTTWFDWATMNFRNVRLILAREVRDQLRDRRTLFMIFVLPILLYPLLGTAYFQMIQFQTRNSMSVLVVGGEQLASAPTPLVEGAGFSPQLFYDGERGAELLTLKMEPEQPTVGDATADASRRVQAKEFDAALVFPPDFAKRLEAYRMAIKDDASAKKPSPPAPQAGKGSQMPSPRPGVPGTPPLPGTGEGVWSRFPAPRSSTPRRTSDRRWPATGWRRFSIAGPKRSARRISWRAACLPRRCGLSRSKARTWQARRQAS